MFRNSLPFVLVTIMLLSPARHAFSDPATNAPSPLVQPAVDFRVTTTIYEGKKEAPVAQHLVIFYEGLVYDLPQIDDSILTVFDPIRGRVILLDRNAQQRCTVSTEDLVKMTAQLRAAADTDRARARLGLLAEVLPVIVDPKTDEAAPIDLEEADATIASDGFMVEYGDVRYEVRTQSPRQPAVASQYGQFADWALRLNVARRLGLAPFGRMALNQRITSASQLPHETRLTIRRGLLTDRYRSTHELVERVSESDKARVNEVGGMLALYKEVPLEQFP